MFWLSKLQICLPNLHQESNLPPTILMGPPGNWSSSMLLQYGVSLSELLGCWVRNVNFTKDRLGHNNWKCSMLYASSALQLKIALLFVNIMYLPCLFFIYKKFLHDPFSKFYSLLFPPFYAHVTQFLRTGSQTKPATKLARPYGKEYKTGHIISG